MVAGGGKKGGIGVDAAQGGVGAAEGRGGILLLRQVSGRVNIGVRGAEEYNFFSPLTIIRISIGAFRGVDQFFLLL